MAEMSKVVLRLSGIGPLLFGKPVHEDKRDNETHEQKEERTWQMKAHTDGNGKLVMPAASVHKSFIAGGAWLSLKIPGERNKTYTKRLQSGMMPSAPYCELSNGKKVLTIDDCERLPLFVDSTGKKGGSSRVWKFFPKLKPGWWLEASLIVTDECLTEEIILKHAVAAGLHDGLGSMRVGTGGPNGMYTVEVKEFTPYDM